MSKDTKFDVAYKAMMTFYDEFTTKDVYRMVDISYNSLKMYLYKFSEMGLVERNFVGNKYIYKVVR